MILLYLACLFPLAVYLLILAVLNRGPQPVLVSGPWDFAGVLLGAAGFLLFGGPVVLNGLYEQAHLAALVEPSRLTTVGALLRPLAQLPWGAWLAVWGLYFLIVTVGAAYLLWRKQGALAIYNITSDDFALVLSHVLHRRGLEGKREGQRLRVQRGGAEEHAVVEITAWPAVRHVSWRWLGESPLRQEVETELARTLATFATGNNPLSGWLIGLAGGFFVSLFFGLVGYLFVIARALMR